LLFVFSARLTNIAQNHSDKKKIVVSESCSDVSGPLPDKEKDIEPFVPATPPVAMLRANN
jgi:hypothetical protein